MELYLQAGHGMGEHCVSLVTAWGGGTTILSPRDLDDAGLRRLAGKLHHAVSGANVLLDPQFYLPHADHQRLTSHRYWPEAYATGDFWTGPELVTLLAELRDLNVALGTKEIILPAYLATIIDDDWLARQASVINEAKRQFGKPLLATVSLGAQAVESEDNVHELLEYVSEWQVDGIYLVCEHPRGDYLVRSPAWLANVMDLVAGVRLKGKRVVVGYCNHQMLPLACSAANAIASGTWMNVRSFPPEKFREKEEEVKNRSTWYYCPQALSEYTEAFLDMAHKSRMLDHMRPDAELGSNYGDVLFSGPQPSTVGFTEPMAFRHYLQCLSRQSRDSSADSFDKTVDIHEKMLDRAEGLLSSLHAVGVRGQLRDFRECIDVSRAAITSLRNVRGPVLRRRWDSINDLAPPSSV